jgi:riboflavin kinase/FMN adenylyltransferase
MNIVRGVSSVHDALRGAVLTVGNFDGLHLGHQRILRTACALAQVSSASVVAMTFEPHPLEILRPARAPKRITPWAEKLRLLERSGVDAVVRLDTDWPLLSLSAEDFVREILVKRIHPSYIVEGPNFGFGRDRKGSTATLHAMSARGGFQVHVVEPYRLARSSLSRADLVDKPDDASVVVSSTVVRRFLSVGAVEDAAHCLGRPFTLTGRVVHGAGAGRKLGFPTINLDLGEQLVPADGVYAGIVNVAGMRRPAAVSIGTRPTLRAAAQDAGLSAESPVVVEAYVLDEAGDWYAEEVRLDLWSRLRDQRRFESREELTGQIAQDVESVRRVAAACGGARAQAPAPSRS